MIASNSISNFFNPPIERIIGSMLAVGVFILLSGNILFVITESKFYYYAFSVICVLILLLNRRSYINTIKLLYFLPILISFAFNFSANYANPFFLLSVLPYFLIPLVFYNGYFQGFSLSFIMKIFEWFTILNFLGLLLQLSGIESPFLYLGYAFTNNVYHERYGSFAGGTLALGLGATVSTIHSFHKIVYEKQKSTYNIIVLLVAIATMILAQSRRFYIMAFIMMAVVYFFNPEKKYDSKKIIRVLSGMLITILISSIILYQAKGKFFYLERLLSIVDFKNDPANLERITKWLMAIDAFLSHFWMGMGIGAAGIIGKNFNETVSVTDVFVAESYYLKVFVEAGVVSGCVFLGLMIFFLRKAITCLRIKEVALPALFIVFFFIDSFMSTSLEGPLWALLFWICVAVVMNHEEVIIQPAETKKLSLS